MKKELAMDVTMNIIREIFGEAPVDFSTEKLEKGIYYLNPRMVFPDNPELWEETTLLPVGGAQGVVIGVAPYQTVWEEDEPRAYTGETWYFPDVLIALGVIDRYYGHYYKADTYKVCALEEDKGWTRDGKPTPVFKVRVDWWQDGVERMDEFRIWTDDFKVAPHGDSSYWPGFGYWDSVAEAEEEGGEE